MKKVKAALITILITIIINIGIIITSFIAFGCTYDMSFNTNGIGVKLAQIYGLMLLPAIIIFLIQMILLLILLIVFIKNIIVNISRNKSTKGDIQ